MIPAKFIAFASLLLGALATPIASPAAEPEAEVAIGSASLIDERGEIVKRVEGVHLINCGPTVNNAFSWRYSVIVYCPNDGNCRYAPNNSNSCKYNYVLTWEGGEKSCKFSTGVTFRWNIMSNAQSLANWSNVGWGNNVYKQFVIRKDDKNVFYKDASGYDCRSIYYSLPN
ncbi:hypothetical protein QBC38DRAFT_500487 [Podospora fimiseda]|uniref:Secreted protein n=1 Tax=Podospora fimiseda TaxID=252190 RepID=A0AAN7H2E7_9PEZI|nr:hypothetical protein QBC38DRAFT_500487 [Podospora fimiseda]